MYPSTNNNGGNYTFTHTSIQPITFSSFYDNCNNNDINLSQHHYYLPSSSPFQILSPEDHRRLNTNTVLHEQIPTPDIWASVQSAIGKCSDNNGNFVINGDAGKSGTRRSTNASKKDRHSKIYTARGPRDRRMRLSIEVAKKFFKLQDMLGFDKASETVDWLLMKSKSGIQELLPQPECDHQFLSGNIDDRSIMKSKKKIRKSAYLPRPLAKETREKARARARERTMVKSNRSLACLDPDLNLLDSNCTFNQLKQGTIDDNWSSLVVQLSAFST